MIVPMHEKISLGQSVVVRRYLIMGSYGNDNNNTVTMDNRVDLASGLQVYYITFFALETLLLLTNLIERLNRSTLNSHKETQ